MKTSEKIEILGSPSRSLTKWIKRLKENTGRVGTVIYDCRSQSFPRGHVNRNKICHIHKRL